MKRLLLLLAAFSISALSFGVTVKYIPGDYSSVYLAIQALNSGVPAGGITYNVAAGYTETITAPLSITVTGTVSDPVIFQKDPATTGANPLITAYAGGTGTPGSAIQDGMWNLIGSDYVTIDGIDLYDPNTANPATMEYGYAMFKASVTNGCQYNTIKNCVVTLSRTNNSSGTSPAVDGSRAINVMNSLVTTQTTVLTPTAASGTNSYNVFYSNTLQNCNIGIALIGYAGVTPFTLCDFGNDIGGSSLATGNSILNYGGAASATLPAAGVRTLAQYNLNVSYNTVNNNNGSGVNHPSTLRGIYLNTAVSASATISYNNLTISSGALSSQVSVIENVSGGTAAGNTININNNTITGAYTTASSGAFYCIYNTAAAATVNINYNTISGISTPGTGAIYGISGGSPTALNVTYNNITSLTKTGNGSIYGIQLATATITCQNNTVDGLSGTAAASTATLYGIYDGASAVIENYSNNIVRNISTTGTATIYGLGINTATGNKTVQNNQLYNITVAGGGTIYGFSMGYGSTDVISDNQIHDLSITGTASGTIYGLRVAAGTLNSVYQNKISALSCASGTAGAIYGLYIATGTTNNVYRNEVCNLSTGSSNPVLYGAYIVSGTTNNFSNNLIGDLRTPAANAGIPLAGIYVSGGTNANIYYNTVYLNATSSGVLFGSAAIYASTTPNLDLRNNILVNTSTPNGTGYTVAYRRSGASLTAYLNSSNNNFYFAGTPSATNLVYYDGTTPYSTLLAYQGWVTPRDAASVTSATGPSFVSTTCGDADFLHIIPSVSSVIESGGTAILNYDNDYDGNIRQGSAGYPVQINGGGSAPDIGGDEFDGVPNYTCSTPAPGATVASVNPICLGQAISLSLANPTAGTGVTYQWQSSSNGTDFSNIPLAISATYSTSPALSMYYQCIVTCQNGPVSVTSTPIQITFTNSITSTTPDSRCGTGTVILNAAGTGTLNWYSAVTGGTLLGTGSPWTTPSITTTTTFYVGAESISPGNATVGAGVSTSTGSESPFYYLWGGHKSQFLVKASELSAAGLSAGDITALSFEVVASNGTVFQGFNLSLGATASNVLTTTFETGLQNVYSTVAPAGITPTTGIFTISFPSNPFYWNGSANIVVETCWSNNNSGASASSATVKFDPTSFVSNAYRRTDNVTPEVICANTTGTATMSSRPKMIFAGQSSCSSLRSAVVATVIAPPDITVTANQTVCNNAVATISVTSPLANFDSYTWSPVENLFTDFDCLFPYSALSSATTVYFKSETAGAYTFTCTGSNSVSLCVNTTTTTVTNLPASPVITATPAALCISGTSVLTTVPATGYGTATFQWQISTNGVDFSDITDATAISYSTPTITATTYYKLLVKLGTTVCTESNIATISVNNPSVTGIPGSRCGFGTVDLGATGSGIFSWYSAATGGTALGTGPSFTTPVISATTDFWVEASSGGGGLTTVGPVSPTAQGGTIATQTVAWNVNFTTLVPSSIKSVDIFPIASGQAGVIKVITGSTTGGTVLATINYTTSVSGGSTAQTILIDFPLPTPGSYNLYTSTLPSSGISRNTTGAVYPYTSTVANITGNGYDPNYFMGMYNWKFGSDCVTPRQAVTATVNPAPVIIPTATPPSICEGQSSVLNVTSSDPNYTYEWTPGNLPGTPHTVTPAITTIYTVTANDGTSNCANAATVTVTVNPLPSALTVTPPTAAVGSIQQLVASGGTLGVSVSDGFETFPSPNFAASGTAITPAASTTYYSEGIQSVRLSYTGTAITTTSSTNNSYELQSNFDLNGSTSAQLTFSHICALEGYTYTYDAGYVSYSTDGGATWTVFPATSYAGSGALITTIGSGTGTPVSGVIFSTKSYPDWITQFTSSTSTPGTGPATSLWKTETINIPTELLTSSQFRIRFQLTCDVSVAYYGWLIDNIVFTATASTSVTWSPGTGLWMDNPPSIPYSGQVTNTVYANPASAVTYTATATSSAGCTSSGTCVFTGSSKTLNLSYLFPEGLYAGSNTLNPAYDEYGTHFLADTADMITVELHQSDNYAQIKYSTPAALSTSGTSTVSIPDQWNEYYYLTIKHRNSIETTSADLVDFSGAVINYPFNTQARAYGSNMGLMIDGAAVFYGGDENQDQIVDGTDLSEIGNLADFATSGYLPQDINGDGLIDGSDLSIAGNNADYAIGAVLP